MIDPLHVNVPCYLLYRSLCYCYMKWKHRPSPLRPLKSPSSMENVSRISHPISDRQNVLTREGNSVQDLMKTRPTAQDVYLNLSKWKMYNVSTLEVEKAKRVGMGEGPLWCAWWILEKESAVGFAFDVHIEGERWVKRLTYPSLWCRNFVCLKCCKVTAWQLSLWPLYSQRAFISGPLA